jgi:SAM-dependent methyltransferase
LGPDSLVVEAASNDGYMLRHFKESGIPVLGIDPAEAPVRRAIELGIPTEKNFFSAELAKQLVECGKKADVFLANNVLAHVPDLNGFVSGIATMLNEDGLAVIEVPYVVDLIDHCEFDTVYHQHLCYFSVTALRRLFISHGLFLNRIKRTSIHGGSLRLFVEKSDDVEKSVLDILQMESDRSVDKPVYYLKFASRVNEMKAELRKVIDRLKSDGLRIAGYGAAAKACTLMAYCGIGKDDLEFVVDRNEFKQGKYFPGNRVPILGVDAIDRNNPDVLLILAWNFADEIMGQLSEFVERGGSFLIQPMSVDE